MKFKRSSSTNEFNTVDSLVLTEFFKAFDCVDHTLAIISLYDLGVRAEIILDCRLTFRRQRVQHQSATSTFISMIDSAASKTHTLKYVDDLSLAEVRPANQPSQIENDVQDFDDWANSQYLKLNPSKCKVMHVCMT